MGLNISDYRPNITGVITNIASNLNHCQNYLMTNIPGDKILVGGLLFAGVVTAIAAAKTGDVDGVITQLNQTGTYVNLTDTILHDPSNPYNVVGIGPDVNIEDIVKIAQNVGTNNSAFDVTGDGLVTVADVDAAYQHITT